MRGCVDATLYYHQFQCGRRPTVCRRSTRLTQNQLFFGRLITMCTKKKVRGVPLPPQGRSPNFEAPTDKSPFYPTFEDSIEEKKNRRKNLSGYDITLTQNVAKY